MIKNAMRIGRLLALASLLSIALAAPGAVMNAGAYALSQDEESNAYASWVAPSATGTAAQATASGEAERYA